ncbi:MAG: hypothetical protein PHW34_09230 [Hespellia sp.]|nr:hypothetical protein [Hespellia sp.]
MDCKGCFGAAECDCRRCSEERKEEKNRIDDGRGAGNTHCSETEFRKEKW